MRTHDDQHEPIDNEVRRTLGSLNALDEIEPGPYFETQVMQRIAALSHSEITPRWWRTVALQPVPVLLAVMFVLNLVTTWWVLPISPGPESTEQPTAIDALAGDYTLNGGWLTVSDAPVSRVNR